MRRIPLLLLVALVLGAAPVHADTPCPKTAFFTLVGERNQGDSTVVADGSLADQLGGDTAHLSFDMAAGVFDVSSSAGTRGIAELEPRDTYTIEGLPPGTPVSFIARLHGSGRTRQQCGPPGTPCSAAGLVVRIWDIPGNTMFWALGNPTGSATGSGNADLPLVRYAGQPFELFMDVTANSYAPTPLVIASVSGEAVISFLGLPPGAIVTSCKGYLLAPVPTTRDSWGALKIRYR